jgi:hypothetical protein
MNSKKLPQLIFIVIHFCCVLRAQDFITWSTPQRISNIYLNSWLPYIAIDGNGNELCLWRQLNANSQRAVAARYDASLGQWQEDATIISKAVSGQGAYEQKIAMDGQGNAWAIWRQMSGATKVIQASYFDNSSGWWPIADALTLTDTTKDAYCPVISMNSQGVALGVWTWDAMVQASFANSTNWTASVILSDSSAAQVDCFINNQGDATVVWQRFSVDHYQIESSTYSNGSWQPTVIVSTDTNNAYSPKIVMDDNGNALVVWFECPRGQTDPLTVYASKKSVGSSWQTPQLISLDIGDAKFPQVAMNDQGNCMVLWEQYDGSNWYIAGCTGMFAQSDWDPAVQISQAGHDAFDPQIVINIYGNAVATWMFYDANTIKRIQAARYDAKSKKWTNSLSQPLLSDSQHDSQSPKIAYDPKLVIAWQIFEGFNWKIDVIQGVVAQPIVTSTRQELHRFPRSAYIANCITWNPVAGAVAYAIFAADNTTLLAQIPATSKPSFCGAQQVPCSSYTYYIYAVNAEGIYSDPAVVTIP